MIYLPSNDERTLINMLSDRECWKITDVKQVHNKEFDLLITGKNPNGEFRSNLMLAAIKRLVPWNTAEVAAMTDHVVMTRSGDWSGVRDSSEEKLWAIFDKYVVPQIHPAISRSQATYTKDFINVMVKKLMAEAKVRHTKAKLTNWFIAIDAHNVMTLNVEYTTDGSWKSSLSMRL